MSEAVYDQHGVMGHLMGFPKPEEDDVETLKKALLNKSLELPSAMREIAEVSRQTNEAIRKLQEFIVLGGRPETEGFGQSGGTDSHMAHPATP